MINESCDSLLFPDITFPLSYALTLIIVFGITLLNIADNNELITLFSADSRMFLASLRLYGTIFLSDAENA